MSNLSDYLAAKTTGPEQLNSMSRANTSLSTRAETPLTQKPQIGRPASGLRRGNSGLLAQHGQHGQHGIGVGNIMALSGSSPMKPAPKPLFSKTGSTATLNGEDHYHSGDEDDNASVRSGHGASTGNWFFNKQQMTEVSLFSRAFTPTISSH